MAWSILLRRAGCCPAVTMETEPEAGCLSENFTAVCLCGKDAPDSIKQPGVNSQLLLLFQVFGVFLLLRARLMLNESGVRVDCRCNNGGSDFCYESLQQLHCVIFNACDALKTLTAGQMDFVVTCCLQTCWRTL